MSDVQGAALTVDDLPPTKGLLGDQGYDADCFRDALAERSIESCIPAKASRKEPFPHNQKLYRQRPKIENTLGRIKD